MDSPDAPDPMATAQAQQQMNTQTATTQQQLNMVNQFTPDGSLTYSRDGSWGGGVPRYTATTALSPGQQGIYDTTQATKQNVANIGRDQSARIGDILGTPLKLGNEATEARLMELGMSRLTPQFARDDEALRTKLANSGIRAGSAAFDAEMGRLGQNKNDAITQLLLKGRGQANQEILSERNQPINEITALMSGSQISNPNFQSTPQSNVAGVDYSGLVSDQYKQETAQYNAMLGGMFGLAGSVVGGGSRIGAAAMPMSDRRLKTDIERVGQLDNGLSVYLYRFKAGGPFQIGLMADDVEGVHPEAVATGLDGFKRVDYAQATEPRHG